VWWLNTSVSEDVAASTFRVKGRGDGKCWQGMRRGRGKVG